MALAPAHDDTLNAPQAEAVAHVKGPLLVFAGAGSGKTRVITYRVANLVACERVPPYRILAVTFTNKAAGEMKSRLQNLLGEEVARDLWVGTFHATCARLLRRYGRAVDLPKDFLIYDTQDQKQLMTRVLKELDLDDRRYPPRTMLSRIHQEKQEGRGPEEMAANADSYVDDAVVKVYRRYQEMLREAGAVDFEDLIGLMVKILENDAPPDGSEIRRRFEHVLVDEFQDTNAMQYRMLRALARDHQNLCVVGDDDQSIYRWRGADVRNIRGFHKDFPGAHVVKLEQNYRSSGRIVRAALGVITPSRERVPKELWTENVEGPAIEVVAARDEHDEAAHVVRTILDAKSAGTSLKEIAVFYRVHAQSRVLEESLRAANVSYQIIGGTKFYERAEIKDALGYLRILVNPRSDVDLLRIINTPARGIGTTTIERIVAFARIKGVPVHDALALVDESPDIATAARKKLHALRALLTKLREDATHHLPSEVLLHVLEWTGYEQALRAENSAEADARLENLGELVGSLKDYETEATSAGEAPSLAGYLERVSLQSDVDGMQDDARVTLMTVHGAKGLEFERVLLTGMEEEMFPYRGMEPGTHEEMEEERRLAYVAITRARKHLTMTHTSTRQIFGNTRWGRPSRFLGDMPEDVFVQKRTRAAASSPAPERFVDRSFATRELAPMPEWRRASPSSSAPPSWRSSFEPPKSAAGPLPGERYVDTDFFSDDAGSPESSPLRRGSKVFHARFGEGEVKSVVNMGEPAVVAFFPGWGEKKVLARFLKIART